MTPSESARGGKHAAGKRPADAEAKPAATGKDGRAHAKDRITTEDLRRKAMTVRDIAQDEVRVLAKTDTTKAALVAVVVVAVAVSMAYSAGKRAARKAAMRAARAGARGGRR